MSVQGTPVLNKLILLFVFDKMEVPLSLSTIQDMCCQSNDWLNFMDCNPTLSKLLDGDLVYKIDMQNSEPLYALTANGRVCLAEFFINIPTSLRENISQFVKKNKTRYRKRQEYVADYYMNKDGTFTVYLKIVEPIGTPLELKLTVPSKQIAKNIYKKWENKAESLFSVIYENIID